MTTTPAAPQPAVSTAELGYHARLTNDDLKPLVPQTWSGYNIFAFWMSDVHSVGGYVTAGSLFALGLTSWQVLAHDLTFLVSALNPYVDQDADTYADQDGNTYEG